MPLNFPLTVPRWSCPFCSKTLQRSLEVRDHGAGIQNEDRAYIFNPFFSTQVHAPGMGLAIVERVVHEHMGKIEVDSEPGQGTAIRIILPSTLHPERRITVRSGLTRRSYCVP